MCPENLVDRSSREVYQVKDWFWDRISVVQGLHGAWARCADTGPASLSPYVDMIIGSMIHSYPTLASPAPMLAAKRA